MSDIDRSAILLEEHHEEIHEMTAGLDNDDLIRCKPITRASTGAA